MRTTDPTKQSILPAGPVDLCAVVQEPDPRASAVIYKAEPRHEGERPEGAYIFLLGKKRLNYILNGTDTLRNTSSV